MLPELARASGDGVANDLSHPRGDSRRRLAVPTDAVTYDLNAHGGRRADKEAGSAQSLW